TSAFRKKGHLMNARGFLLGWVVLVTCVGSLRSGELGADQGKIAKALCKRGFEVEVDARLPGRPVVEDNAIDLIITAGPGKGTTQQLRYELHDKTLRLAWEDLTKGRPKEMKTATDSTFGISTFQRDELPRKPPKEKKEPKDNDQAVSWGKPI